MSASSALRTVPSSHLYESITHPATADDSVDDSPPVVPDDLPSARALLSTSTGVEVVANQAEFVMRATTPSVSVNSSRASSVVLAEWNGCVTRFDSEASHFSAALTGIRGRGVSGEEEDAQIPVDDVSAYDRALLQPGNFFRLSVVYEVAPNGQPRRSTQVVFRRLPVYLRDDLQRVEAEAREFARGLRVE